MNELRENGKYTVSDDIFNQIKELFWAGCCDDYYTKVQIYNTNNQYGYTVDTHTSVAIDVYKQYKEQTGDNTKTVIASTASPYKFAANVLDALGKAASDDEFATVEEWKQQCYRIGAKLHPLTIEQNALTSFKSRTTLVPCSANTIGPGLFLQADYIIGGCDGVLGRGMGWQGMSFLTTLHYGPDMNVTSTFMPTLPGKLFYLKELAGPLVAECN
jgi:hypothetical protein